MFFQKFNQSSFITEQRAATAFTARPSSPIGNLQDYQQLKFDYVLTAAGDAYDRVHGVFRCSIQGTYAFHVTIVVYPNTWVQTELMVGNTPIAYTYSAGTGTRYDSGSTLVTVNLKSDDIVWLRVVSNFHTNGSVNVIDTTYSSFSGYLVYAD